MENMRMPELKALVREHGLRNYSQLRKALLEDNEHQVRSVGKAQAQRPPPPQRCTAPALQMSTWEPERENELEAPLTKKHLSVGEIRILS